MTSVFQENGERFETQKPREGGHVKTEAETAVTLPKPSHASSYQKLEEARTHSQRGPSQGVCPNETLLSDSRAVGE